MGRPPKNEADKKGRITLAIHKPIIKAMQAIADDEHRSLSGQVELVLTDYVKLHKSMKKKVDGRNRV